jgi:predicted RNA binding protein YcfA (HicA-like mRNA interferase family)
MGSKYPLLPARDIIQALRKIGFEEVSQRGSHRKLQNDSEPIRAVIVPMYDEVARGTLRSILEQAGIDLETFSESL